MLKDFGFSNFLYIFASENNKQEILIFKQIRK